MNDIQHRVGIKSSADNIYQLLTTDSGLTQWWTNDVSGAGEINALIKFRFNGGGPDFTVVELLPNKRVGWQHSGSVPEAWIGTSIVFELVDDGGQTFVNFTHANWTEATDFMAHCNTKWAVFLLSLKDAAETGKGAPFPNDTQIDHS
jgi:uncharacterized protein YndB with AHSA1/START domain